MEDLYQNYPDREHIAGISNYNSSCWLNSSLQALIACPSLEKLFLINPFTIDQDIFKPKITTDKLFSKLQDFSESICTLEFMRTDEYLSDNQDKYNQIIYPFQFIASPELCLDFFSVFKTIFYSEGVVDIRNFYNTYFTRFKLAKQNNLINPSLENKFTFLGFNDAADFLQYLFSNLYFFQIYYDNYNPYKLESSIYNELLKNLKLDGMQNIFILLRLGENPEYESGKILKKNMQEYLTEQENQLKDELEDTIFIKLELNTGKKSFLKPNHIITLKNKRYILCSVIVFVGDGHFRVVTRKYRADDNRIDIGTKPIMDFCNNGYDYIDGDRDICPGYIYVYDSYENYIEIKQEYLESIRKFHQEWNIQNVSSLLNLLRSSKGSTIHFYYDNFKDSPSSSYWQQIKNELLEKFEEIEEKRKILRYFEKDISKSLAKGFSEPLPASSSETRVQVSSERVASPEIDFIPREIDLSLDDRIPVYFKRFDVRQIKKHPSQKISKYFESSEDSLNAFNVIKTLNVISRNALIICFKNYCSELGVRGPGGAAAIPYEPRVTAPSSSASDNPWDTKFKEQKKQIIEIAGDKSSSINFELTPQDILQNLSENRDLEQYQKEAIAEILLTTMSGGYTKYKKYLKYKNKYLQIKRLEK
jgi:hypothetical protein